MNAQQVINDVDQRIQKLKYELIDLEQILILLESLEIKNQAIQQ